MTNVPKESELPREHAELAAELREYHGTDGAKAADLIEGLTSRLARAFREITTLQVSFSEAHRRANEAAEQAIGYRNLLRDVSCPVNGCDGGTVYRSVPGGWDEPITEAEGPCPWCAALEELEAEPLPVVVKDPVEEAPDEVF